MILLCLGSFPLSHKGELVIIAVQVRVFYSKSCLSSALSSFLPSFHLFLKYLLTLLQTRHYTLVVLPYSALPISEQTFQGPPMTSEGIKCMNYLSFIVSGSFHIQVLDFIFFKSKNELCLRSQSLQHKKINNVLHPYPHFLLYKDKFFSIPLSFSFVIYLCISNIPIFCLNNLLITFF